MTALLETIAGWEIVHAHGLTMVGRPVDFPLCLRPVYELKTSVSPARGIPETQRACYPLLWLASLLDLRIPPDAIRIEIDSLDRSERTSIAKAVAQCELGLRAMRAKMAGVTVDEPTGKIIT